MEERNEKSKKEERKEKRKNEEKKERQLCNPVTFCLTSKEDFSLLQVIHLCTCYEISIVSKLIACTGKERMASWLLYGYFTKLMRQQMIFNPIKKTKHSLFSTLKKKFLHSLCWDWMIWFYNSGSPQNICNEIGFLWKTDESLTANDWKEKYLFMPLCNEFLWGEVCCL